MTGPHIHSDADSSPHLGLLAVRDRGEGDHVAICIHEAGVVLLPVQQVQVPGGSTQSQAQQ